jgi:hypothetical protein
MSPFRAEDDSYSDYAETELDGFMREMLFQDFAEGTETFTGLRRQPAEPDESDSGGDEVCCIKANVGFDNPKVRCCAPPVVGCHPTGMTLGTGET